MRIAIAALVLAGCFEQQVPCDTPTAPLQLINPANLVCETLQRTTCDPAVEPSPPTWGACDSPCLGKSEAVCDVWAGCHIARDRASGMFLDCFPVDTSGPALPRTASCDPALDAVECSRHDDCDSLFDPGPGGLEQYVGCVGDPMAANKGPGG